MYQQNYWLLTVCNLPLGPTANLKGLKVVDVSTDAVKDERADVINGELPWLGGRSPKEENKEGVPGVEPGPGLELGGCDVFGVKSRAPREFDSENIGLPACCEDGGRGIWKSHEERIDNKLEINWVDCIES